MTNEVFITRNLLQHIEVHTHLYTSYIVNRRILLQVKSETIRSVALYSKNNKRTTQKLQNLTIPSNSVYIAQSRSISRKKLTHIGPNAANIYNTKTKPKHLHRIFRDSLHVRVRQLTTNKRIRHCLEADLSHRDVAQRIGLNTTRAERKQNKNTIRQYSEYVWF